MKTIHDTKNNNSSTTNNTTEKNIPSSIHTRQNSIVSDRIVHNNLTIIDSNVSMYPLLSIPNHTRHQTNWRTNSDLLSCNNTTRQITSTSKFTIQNNNNIDSNSLYKLSHPLTSILNGDSSHLSSIMQACSTKFDGHEMFQMDVINPSFYLQLINANTMLMQQLLTTQNHTFSTGSNSINSNLKSTIQRNQEMPTSNNDLPREVINSGRNSQRLHVDSNIFVPKTRSMTQNEIAEHARLVYQRALRRNRLQQHSSHIKHFPETLNINDSNIMHNTIKSTNHNEVPSVPNIGNIAATDTFDILDTMTTSPSLCLSGKEASVNGALSSLSLISVEEAKTINNVSSKLDPSAPVFIPRRCRSKRGDDDDHDHDHETSSSSSDSDFNGFHYLGQFLDEFYSSHNEHDNHLLIQKTSSSETTNVNDKTPDNNNTHKHTIINNVLGQGDATEQSTYRITGENIEQLLSATVEKQEGQYSIYELLNRYRNPRCHLVLPEWSRLSLILPNVCSMRAHTYKIKRYFAYRRRLYENQDFNKDLNAAIPTNIFVQG